MTALGSKQTFEPLGFYSSCLNLTALMHSAGAVRLIPTRLNFPIKRELTRAKVGATQRKWMVFVMKKRYFATLPVSTRFPLTIPFVSFFIITKRYYGTTQMVANNNLIHRCLNLCQ